MKLIITKGLPASGKSTWSKAYCEKNKNYIRVNRDDLRNMRGEYWIPKQEGLITKMEHSLIDISLSDGFNVIMDATNLNPNYTDSFVDELKGKYKDLKVEVKFFDVDVEECIKRDLKRPNSVGEKVIRGMYDKYLKPKTEPIVYEEMLNLPKAYIFDIDGTLALMSGRSPYDYSKVDTDLINYNVWLTAKRLEKHGHIHIIIMSGREDSCKEMTESWLRRKGIKYDAIYMRKAGDMRKDSIIKKELFENNIRGKYYVNGVFDDRNQVVDMWRNELGLTCFQVAEGNF